VTDHSDGGLPPSSQNQCGPVRTKELSERWPGKMMEAVTPCFCLMSPQCWIKFCPCPNNMERKASIGSKNADARMNHERKPKSHSRSKNEDDIRTMRVLPPCLRCCTQCVARCVWRLAALFVCCKLDAIAQSFDQASLSMKETKRSVHSVSSSKEELGEDVGLRWRRF